MNGTKPIFLKDAQISPSYYESPNPYKNAPSCNVNLLQLSRYAKKLKKKLVELTKEEVQMFAMG